MSVIDILARARAWTDARAVTMRERATLSSDPPTAFGIAPIKLVSEEHVQAIAYGFLDAMPSFVTRWHPLGRDSSELVPFAIALDAYLMQMLSKGFLPRIWISDTATMDLLETMGHRFHSNQHASVEVRRMGKELRLLSLEGSIPGQQVVAVAHTLLMGAMSTGQTGAEDAHLGALMAWVNPRPGQDTVKLAAERALIPATAMLDRQNDDLVEALRRQAKGSGRRAALARKRIRRVLEQGAGAQWNLLIEARDAYLSLGLSADHLEPLVEGSRERLRFGMSTFPEPGRSPTALLAELDRSEHAIALVEDLDLADYGTRERARRSGHVFAAKVLTWNPPDPRENGFIMQLHAGQEILRVRRGSMIRLLDGKIRAIVSDVEAHENGGYLLTVKV
ncbi:MAG: hypothetical protein WBM00_01560, partial [Solirubrobacterales bacterium]